MFLLLLVFNPTNFYFILINTFFLDYSMIFCKFKLLFINKIFQFNLHRQHCTFKFRLKTSRQHTDRNTSSVEDLSEYSFNLLCPYLVQKKSCKCFSLFYSLLPDVGAVSEGDVSTHEKSLPQF